MTRGSPASRPFSTIPLLSENPRTFPDGDDSAESPHGGISTRCSLLSCWPINQSSVTASANQKIEVINPIHNALALFASFVSPSVPPFVLPRNSVKSKSENPVKNQRLSPANSVKKAAKSDFVFLWFQLAVPIMELYATIAAGSAFHIFIYFS
jgi:hypothetical protein